MCGIAGYIRAEQAVSRREFSQMVDAIGARGPDGRGERYFDDDRVALGHRRLAIVDLTSSGTQPIANEDERCWLTFNGEIYNHMDLRRRLEREGHVYRSNCDAETVVHAYEQWGEECVHHFRGIFAFAIWDSKEKSLFAARDHVGVKPFYYLQLGLDLAFCSQPKGLLQLSEYKPLIDHKGVVDYLSYGVVPHDRAAFANMRKLAPAHTLTWKDGHIKLSRYWEVRPTATITDLREAKERIGQAIEHAVSLQLMSDVPIGCFLSGGIDSSVVTSIAARYIGKDLRTFTIGFNEVESDERGYARILAEHCRTTHHESVLEREYAFGMMDELTEIYDEPYALGAAFPMIFLSKFTQQNNTKVVLAGDGADELFAGYHHYDEFSRLYQKWGRQNANGSAPIFKQLLASLLYGTFEPVESYFPREGVLTKRILESLLSDHLLRCEVPDTKWRLRKFFDPKLDAVTAARLMDMNTYLPDEILSKVDRATMAFGVEARVPFLDPELIELAFSVSTATLYQNGERKALLKAIAQDWLPPELLTTRKKGFSIPLRQWLTDPVTSKRVIEELATGVLVSEEILDPRQFELNVELLKVQEVWQFYLLERWARRWISV